MRNLDSMRGRPLFREPLLPPNPANRISAAMIGAKLIWTALIAMLLLRWLKLKARYGWSLSNLLALLRQQLFVYRELYSWLDDPFTAPPAIIEIEKQLVLDLV